MTLDDLVKFGPLVQAAAMAVTAYFASRGLNAWHQQLAGKRRFELGEEILVLRYKLQRDLAHVRMPVSFGEGKSRPRDDGDTESTAGLKDTYFVPLERIKALDSDLAKVLYDSTTGARSSRPRRGCTVRRNHAGVPHRCPVGEDADLHSR